MNSIEFDTKELRESLSKSISEYSKSLETIFADTESLKIKDKQIAAEYLVIFQEGLKYLNENKSELEIRDFKVLAKKIEEELRALLDKYSDFLTEEDLEEINKKIIHLNLEYQQLESFEIILNSTKYEKIFDVLAEIYRGLDIVAQLVENKGKQLEIDFSYIIREILTKILAPITERKIINESSDRLDKEELEEIDRYRRLIDRTINSTLWYLDKYKKEQEEENRKKEQLEKEEKSLERLKAWVEEDQLKDLTQEELEEEDVLMKIIDENRERKLFS